MPPTHVTPERRHSAAPKRAIASMSPKSMRCLRSMCTASHGANERPSPNPAYAAYSRCEWALTNPGTIAAPSNRSPAPSSDAGPTAAIRPSSIATAPSRIGSPSTGRTQSAE